MRHANTNRWTGRRAAPPTLKDLMEQEQDHELESQQVDLTGLLLEIKSKMPPADFEAWFLDVVGDMTSSLISQARQKSKALDGEMPLTGK